MALDTRKTQLTQTLLVNGEPLWYTDVEATDFLWQQMCGCLVGRWMVLSAEWCKHNGPLHLQNLLVVEALEPAQALGDCGCWPSAVAESEVDESLCGTLILKKRISCGGKGAALWWEGGWFRVQSGASTMVHFILRTCSGSLEACTSSE